jgi:YHS domain-containing protein
MKLSSISALLILSSAHWLGITSLRAENSAPNNDAEKQPVNVCIVSGEHLQPGDIVSYVYKEEGKPDRTIRFCCKKCLARFKANPERYLQKLDELETRSKKADKEKADQ